MSSKTKPPIANSYWVLERRFLAGEYPLQDRGGDGVPRELEQLLAAGIDAFIDLTEPEECESYDALLPPAVEYLKRPITDHGLPRAATHMRQIMAEIDQLLGAGRNLYVHCRAGIGRTGMVVGCFLAGRTTSGEAALEELNRLWQQSARSSSWLTIPQTPEQERYILEWPAGQRSAAHQPGTRAPPELRGLRERFQGCLLGLALGDAVGAATQLRKPGSFAPVADLLGGGPFDLPRGAWSDDTATALCLAESLCERGGFDPADQVQRYLQWQQHGYLSATGQCLGITAAMARALATAAWKRQPFAGSHDPAQLDAEPLSRVAPVVLFRYGDPARAISEAADAARISCQAPLVLDACRLLAAMLHLALQGAPLAQMLAPPAALFGARPLRPEVLAVLGAGPAPAGDQDALGVLRRVIGGLRAAHGFRDGLLAVINHGGASDVAGAVFGQLAGARLGSSELPAHWLTALSRRAELVQFADRLLAAAVTRLGAAGAT